MKKLVSLCQFGLLLFVISCQNNTGFDSDLEILRTGKFSELKITSLESFDQVVSQNNTVLNKLSLKALKELKYSLLFSEEGDLATAKFIDAKNELSEEEYVVMWNLFKITSYDLNTIQNSLLPDYEGYKCESEHNCKKEKDYICLDGC